ncbi:hypothetical protein [Draconibacterium sediminis]|uniref:Uncharacterized protein n=1 Tax=Draconibacterium sediminis TaxID=1544798 RepID=A0A0D8J7U3_9BACT|nr:hypothetical protein [Draconibacterium sediminis]KJF42581.1 hypothetical protein LH29_18715 [Draconibacterium sediminis]
MDIKNAQASRVRQTFGENITGQRVSGKQRMKKFSAATCPVDEPLPDSGYYLSARQAFANYFLQLLPKVLFPAFYSLCLFQKNFINFKNPTMLFFEMVLAHKIQPCKINNQYGYKQYIININLAHPL